MEVQVMAVKMDAGTYYVGDPCYVIEQDEWSYFLDSERNPPDDEDNPHAVNDVMIYDYKGAISVSLWTLYGDGEYSGSDGNSYCVDSGTIGVVPVSILTDKALEDADRLGVIVEFGDDFVCKYDGEGVLAFGDIYIDTGEEDYEEDDDYYY